MILAMIGGNHSGSTSTGTSTPSFDPRGFVLSHIDLDFKARKAGFDNVLEADFTVKNGTDYSVKDLEITCQDFAKSGTKIDSNKRVIYDLVKAHSNKKFPNFSMGFIHSQTAKLSCSITDLTIVE